MNKQFCPKCGAAILNEFGNMLAICTSCGASMSFGQTEQKFSLNETEAMLSPSLRPKYVSHTGGKGLYYLFGCIGLLGAGIILAAIGLFGYWYWTNKNTADNDGKIVPPKTQTVRFLTSEPDSLDPQSGSETIVRNALFDGLAEYNNKNSDLTPSLATSWKSNDDATVWTFDLRKDAKWSDGTPITANDFVYSWKRLLKPDEKNLSNAYLLFDIKNAELYNGQKANAEDVGVRAIDDHTLEVTLEKPTPYFYKQIAMTAFRPVPRTAIEKFGENWTKPENIVTSGAFKLKEFSPENQIVVERNPQFWNNADTKLENIIFISDKTVPKGSKPLENTLKFFENGETDAVIISSEPDGAVRNRKDFSRIKTLGTEFLHVNTSVKPFNDVRVRRAFSLAINREKMTDKNLAQFPTDSYLPELRGYKKAESGGYQPQEARKLLAEAGYPQGQNFPEIDYIYNTSERNRELVEFVQAEWQKQLNIKVRLVNLEFRDFLVRRNNLEYNGIARGGWLGDYDDPNSFLYVFIAEKNGFGTGWTDKKFVGMIEKANLETDEAKRYRLLNEAENYMLEQQPVIPLAVTARGFLCRPAVKNLAPNPLGFINWREVFVELN